MPGDPAIRTATSAAALAELAGRFGERFSTATALRERHGQDESWHAPAPPDAVVFPESVDEVTAIVRTCAAHRTPMIAFGVGTSQLVAVVKALVARLPLAGATIASFAPESAASAVDDAPTILRLIAALRG